MKPRSLTQSMSGLHTWCGLLLGWVLFAIFLTGTLAVFDRELNWWTQPELPATSASQITAVQTAQRWLEREQPNASAWNISLPTERLPSLSVSTGEGRRGVRTLLDAETGAVQEARQSVGGSFFFRFHYTLNMPRNIGLWVVGFAAMAMLVAIISGIVIHKKIFKDFFTFRPAKGQRSWLDGHNASAVLLLPFHVMITYTGLVIFFLVYMPAAIDALYDGDRQAMQRDARGVGQQQVAAVPDDEDEEGARGGQRRGEGRPEGMQAGMQRGEGRAEGGRPMAARGEETQQAGARRGEGRAEGNPQRGEGRPEGGQRRERPAERVPLLPLETFIAKGEAHYGPGMLSALAVSNPGKADARVTVRPLLGSRIELTKGEGLVFNGVTGEPLQVPPPSRASQLTQRVMAGLHFAQFGGYPMRWLYFLCALGSCVMIASGLVLYTVKQRKQVKGSRVFLNIAERLNIATVAGLTLACVALLWASRLIPAELAERTVWEVRVFFGVWALALLHAALRPVFLAWREQFCLTAVLCIALPLPDLLSGFPTDSLRIGVDLTAMVLGLLLGWLTRKIPVLTSTTAVTRPRTSPLAGAER